MIEYQIFRTNIITIVWQAVGRITDGMLGANGLNTFKWIVKSQPFFLSIENERSPLFCKALRRIVIQLTTKNNEYRSHDANQLGRALRVPRYFYQKVTHTKCGLISNFLYIIILFQPSLIAFDLKHSPRDIALSRRVKSGVWRRLGMRIAKIFWRRWWEKLTSPIMTSCLALGYWERDTFSTGNLQSFFFFFIFSFLN